MNKENEKKSFRYGGYTFVPSGQFKDYGFKDGASMIEIVSCLHSINRGCVADGHEKYDYKAFYKAAGKDCEADVFFCPQTQELYVPCGSYLAIFDKTATGKEVERRFEKRKVDAPITEGADLQSDALFDDLFDDGKLNGQPPQRVRLRGRAIYLQPYKLCATEENDKEESCQGSVRQSNRLIRQSNRLNIYDYGKDYHSEVWAAMPEPHSDFLPGRPKELSCWHVSLRVLLQVQGTRL